MWTWRRLRCVLGGGHLPITKYGNGRVYRSCFRCEAQIGDGWRTEPGKPRPPHVVEKIQDAHVIRFSRRQA